MLWPGKFKAPAPDIYLHIVYEELDTMHVLVGDSAFILYVYMEGILHFFTFVKVQLTDRLYTNPKVLVALFELAKLELDNWDQKANTPVSWECHDLYNRYSLGKLLVICALSYDLDNI
jgi:hypothetical protein